MPHYTNFCEPDLIKGNKEINVYQAYGDDDFDNPLDFWFIPTPNGVTSEIEETYDSVDIRELGYIEGSTQTPEEWIEANMDKMRDAITPFETTEDPFETMSRVCDELDRRKELND